MVFEYRKSYVRRLRGPQTSWNFRISVLGLGENMSGEHLEIIASPAGRDGLRILALKGRLTLETAACFQDAIHPSLRDVFFARMQATIITPRPAESMDRTPLMNQRVKAVTDTSRLSQFLQIYATVKDAEAALSKGQ